MFFFYLNLSPTERIETLFALLSPMKQKILLFIALVAIPFATAYVFFPEILEWVPTAFKYVWEHLRQQHVT